jgi:hyperosmotically inducible periplasmic protein
MNHDEHLKEEETQIRQGACPAISPGTCLAPSVNSFIIYNQENGMRKMMLATTLITGIALNAGCAVTSGQSTVGQYVDDATITARVKARMAEDPAVSAMRISVETLNATVQLSGFATNQSEKDKAASLTRAVPDVKDVRNNIVVRSTQ